MWNERAPAVGRQAADLTLLDELGRPVAISSLPAPLLAIVFRSIGDEVGRRMLRDYRDVTLALRKAGVNLCGIAQDDPSSLAFLRHERGLGFPLFADPDGSGLYQWGVQDTNAIFLFDRDLRVMQRALGERAPADAMLRYVRRGQLRSRRPSLLARALHFAHAVQHALRPRRLVR
ncbi:MAG TPA: redoxin domain-containing protein [Myxococcales bacterium]|nr:redoxin domain-containing protein [Myxococcales bacterium]